MESFRILFVVCFVILNSSLTVRVHGGEDDSETGISGTRNEGMESRTNRLERDLRREKEARRNLEEQVKQMQEKLSSVTKFQDAIEDTSQNYRNLSSSVTSIIAIRGLRGLETIVTNLTQKMSTFDNNLLRLENEIKYSLEPSPDSTADEALPDIKNFENTEYPRTKFETVSRVRDNVPVCESKYTQQYVPCKEGWFLYGEKCYKWFPEHRRWRAARDRCSNEGGHLATVWSNKIQEFFSIFMILRERKAAVWIGGSDLQKESNFAWEDGSPFIYSQWDHDQPDNRANVEHCIEMRIGVRPRTNTRELGYWNDLDCNGELPYICQLEINEDETKFSPDPRFCSINEGGGFKYREYCFHIVKKRKSWKEAQEHCEDNFNGNLVTILDTEVEMFLNYIASDIEDFWIGIKRQDKSIQKWTSGWHVAHNRMSHDLKEFPERTCVLKAENELWTTAECFREFPFVCETTKTAAPVLKEAPEGWQCPPNSQDWIDLEGESCYFFGTNKNFNWYEANDDCERKGGKLASITSKEEDLILQYFVIKINRAFPNSHAFIGLQRRKSNKHLFEWVDGSALEYKNWRSGEPNSLDEECVEMKINYLDLYYSWNDINCGNTRSASYICSAKKVPPSTTK